jgi:S-disulfanyl-L-cysteine oxidoreductase SoxD
MRRKKLFGRLVKGILTKSIPMFFPILFSALTTIIYTKEVFSWPWSRDMYQTPVSKYNTAPIKETEAIPKGGVNPVVLKKRQLQNPVLVKNSLRELKNPVKPDEASLKNGERLYRSYCLPCHGETGKGDGPVAKKMVPPQDLTSDYAKNLSDGYIFATIAGGGVIMPAQKKGLSEKDIWDIVNFVRKLQGSNVMEHQKNQQEGGNIGQ